jgi:hypothetical protein
MVLKQAGVRGIGSWIASVASIEQHARAGEGPFSGFVSGAQARPGDLVIPVQGEHVAVVTSNRNGVISRHRRQQQQRHGRPGDVQRGERARRRPRPLAVFHVKHC